MAPETIRLLSLDDRHNSISSIAELFMNIPRCTAGIDCKEKKECCRGEIVPNLRKRVDELVL